MTKTLLRVAIEVPGMPDDAPAEGTVEATPSIRRHLDTPDRIVLPEPVIAKFGAALYDTDGITLLGVATPGVAWLRLDPTDAAPYANLWYWTFTERITNGDGMQRHAAIASSIEVLEYGDLIDLDPETGNPETPLTPMWQAYIDAAIADLVAGAPGALDTLNELAAAFGDDPNFAAGVTAALTSLTGIVDGQTTAIAAIAADLATKAAASDLATETTNRTNADSANANAIATETTNRTNAEATLQTDVNRRVKKPDADSWPTYLYGNSYAILAAAYFTAGNHYTQQVAAALNGGSVTSYGVSGKRILDVISGLLNNAAFPGLISVPPAGSKWPGVSARNGLVVIDSIVNDIGHYATMVGVPLPAALPSANTKYLDSMTLAYRAALALITSESRIEQSARSASSGTWTNDSVNAYASGTSVSWTTVPGSYYEYSVTPPQTGPMRGIVFLHGFTVEASVLAMAQQTIAVDGVTQTTRTPSAWERYVGPTGVNVDIGPECVAVTLPVDGNPHTIRRTHSGSNGQVMYEDLVSVPSIDPNPIAVMGGEHPVAYSGWTAAQRSSYHANAKALGPIIRAVVAEFPHAFYVPSTITPNGLWTSDGLHPNDRGMAQRANDLQTALTTAARARLESRRLANLADAAYAIV